MTALVNWGPFSVSDETFSEKTFIPLYCLEKQKSMMFLPRFMFIVKASVTIKKSADVNSLTWTSACRPPPHFLFCNPPCDAAERTFSLPLLCFKDHKSYDHLLHL